MKTIVTHLSPDLDASTACWLVLRFLPGFQNAQVVFVPAGSTLHNLPPDSNPEIIHVDTGLGNFDHHQIDTYTSATKLVYEYLIKKNYLQQKVIKPLERLVEFVNSIDHFAEAYYPDSTSDKYEFCLSQIIEGLKNTLDNSQTVQLTSTLLDAVLQLLKNKVRAEQEINKGFDFQSKFGKCLAVESRNEEVVKLGLKMKYVLVVRKDPVKGNVRIKTLPDKKYDLTPLYKKIVDKDKKGTWFLHISKNMLLNSSSKNPHFIPTFLTLKKIIEIIRSIE